MMVERIADAQSTLLFRLTLFTLVVGTLFTAEVQAGEPSTIPELIADLGHDSYQRRTAAATDLFAAGASTVRPLLHAALAEDREIATRARQILIRLASTSDEAFDCLATIRQADSRTAMVAKRIVQIESVRDAQRTRSIEKVKSRLRLARDAIEKRQWKLADSRIKSAMIVARKFMVSDSSEDSVAQTRVLLNLRQSGDTNPYAFPFKSRQLFAEKLLRHARISLSTSDLATARRYSSFASDLNAVYGVFDDRPAVVSAAIVRRAESMAIGAAIGIAAKRGLEIQPKHVNTRARQLIFDSENLKKIPETWERAWAKEMPDVAKPYRVHGGVI